MRILALVAIATFALDQATKIAVVWWMGLADRLVIDVWPPFLTFRMAWNRGVNFGLFANDAQAVRWGLILLALAICVWVVWWMRRGGHGLRAQLAAGLLVGGALGNVVDRVLYGAVADFLNMSCCGIDNPFAFNVADAAIFAGAIGLVLFADGGRSPPEGRKTP
ncbi:MAG: signal peptidase II [Paracoccaceae bacterium]|nr:MAG: signal peptidase II [Paracoccaceae bacterium]